MALLVSHLVNEGYIKPEANHAVKVAIESALECKQKGEKKTILFNLCGHSYFDMQAYIDYLQNKRFDHEYNDNEIAMAFSGLPKV